MVSFPDGKADGAPSPSGVTSSPLTVSELLFLVGELMLRTGRDFSVLTGMNETREAMLSTHLAQAGILESPTAGNHTAGQLHRALCRAAAAEGAGDIAAMTGSLAAMSVGGGSTPSATVMGSANAVGNGAPAHHSIGDLAASGVAATPATVAPVASVTAAAITHPASSADHADSGAAGANILESFANQALGTVPNSEGPAGATAAPPATDGIRWYAITAGLNVGVYANWNTVAPLVVGVRGACFARYATRGEARRAFLDALARGSVRVVNPPGVMYPDFNPGNVTRHDSDEDEDDEYGPSGGGNSIGGAAVLVA